MASETRTYYSHGGSYPLVEYLVFTGFGNLFLGSRVAGVDTVMPCLTV